MENTNGKNRRNSGATTFRHQPGGPRPDLAVLCDLLQEQGVTHVTIRYEGFGDSGSVEEVALEPENAAIPEWVERRLAELGEGYCPEGYANNDGGYGQLTIFPSEGFAELEHYDKYEDSEAMDAGGARLPPALRERLAQLGVRRIVARFDGYGDSGQFEEMVVTPEGIELGGDVEDQVDSFLRLPRWLARQCGQLAPFPFTSLGRVAVDAHWGRSAPTSDHSREMEENGPSLSPRSFECARWGGGLKTYQSKTGSTRAVARPRFPPPCASAPSENIFWAEEVFGHTIAT